MLDYDLASVYFRVHYALLTSLAAAVELLMSAGEL